MGRIDQAKGNFQNLILQTDCGDNITRPRKGSRQPHNDKSFSISEMYQKPKNNDTKRSYK